MPIPEDPARDRRIHWFGEPWGAPINVDAPELQIPVPVDEVCSECGETFADTDRGFGAPCGAGHGFHYFHRKGCMAISLGIDPRIGGTAVPATP